MFNSLPAHIAWRYLSTKKSHSAVNTISIVSVCGITLATIAIVCVLSVFNGFKEVLGDRLDMLTPQIRIEPTKSKIIDNADSLCNVIGNMPEVHQASCMVTDNALLLYKQREMPVTMIGIDPEAFATMTSVRKLIPEPGKYQLSVKVEENTPECTEYTDPLFADAETLYSDMPELFTKDTLQHQALVSVGVASSMQIYIDDISPVFLYTPRRTGNINLVNPAASFITDSLPICGVFRSEQAQYDANTIFVDISFARKMLQYNTEASAIDILLKPGIDTDKFIKKVHEQTGENLIIKDRLMQQEINFRMVSIEKWMTFVLLGFILIIASFNIISALSMLVIEKESSLKILFKLGATPSTIGQIFAWESIYVNGIGVIAGILIGILLCLVQQHFGLISFGDESAKMIIDAYPVQVLWTDIPPILLLVSLITALTTFITLRFARSRMNFQNKN